MKTKLILSSFVFSFFLLTSCQKSVAEAVGSPSTTLSAADRAKISSTTIISLADDNPSEGSLVFANTSPIAMAINVFIGGSKIKTFDGATINLPKGAQYATALRLYNETWTQLGATGIIDGNAYYQSTIIGEQQVNPGNNKFYIKPDIAEGASGDLQTVAVNYLVNGKSDAFPINLTGSTLTINSSGATSVTMSPNYAGDILRRNIGDIAPLMNEKITSDKPVFFHAITLRSNNPFIDTTCIKNVYLVVKSKDGIERTISTVQSIAKAPWLVTNDITLGIHTLAHFYVPEGFILHSGDELIAYAQIKSGAAGKQFQMNAYPGDLVLTDESGQAVSFTDSQFISGQLIIVVPK